MTDVVMCGILEILQERKGGDLDELYDALPYRWNNTDSPRPTHLLIHPLKKLAEFQLVEAYLDDKLVVPEKFWDLQDKLRFFISPTAVTMMELLGIDFSLRWNPSFGAPSQELDWPQVFVVMPFAPALQDVFEKCIKKVATQIGVTVDRGDNFFTTGAIINDIWSAIFRSKAIIADCTGRNPNVFYEIGIAHTLGRETVLIAQSIDDIPFDLRHLRTVIYEHTPEGLSELENQLIQTLRRILHGIKAYL